LWKIFESIVASASLLVRLTGAIDLLLPKGFVLDACSSSLICSNDEKYPESSKYQTFPFGYELVNDCNVLASKTLDWGPQVAIFAADIARTFAALCLSSKLLVDSEDRCRNR
jgi:hypothetical protein